MSAAEVVLRIPAQFGSRTGRCRLVVREVSASDAPSRDLTAIVEESRVLTGGGQSSFTVHVSDVALAQVEARGGALNLEVHVDVDEDGVFSPGDLLSPDAHPVTTQTVTAPFVVDLVVV